MSAPEDRQDKFQPREWFDLDDAHRRPPGVNIGNEQGDDRTAADIKELHALLPQFTNAELRQIKVLPIGARLMQGAYYIDLQQLERGPFVAAGGIDVGANEWVVAKRDVDYGLWHRLRREH